MNIEFICMFDSGFTLIRVNHAWPKVFGVAEEIALGLSFFEFMPEQQHQQIKTDLSVLGPERRTISCQHAVGLQSHVTAWVHWNYNVLLDEQNAILGYEGVGKMAS